MWLKRSKTLWATQGDRNTQFFHSRATKRYSKNFISRLKKLDGQWSSTKDEVAEILIKYYEDLFTLATPSQSEETL